MVKTFTSALVAISLLTVSGFAGITNSRPTVSLEGEWNFATDPKDIGEKELWFSPEKTLPTEVPKGYAPKVAGKIQVPGVWDAQGYGEESKVLKHNYVGKAWYKRNIEIPADWNEKKIILRVTGVHRYSKTWINSQYLGEHIGYLSEAEYDLTPYVKPGEKATLTIQVDSKQRWDVDGLYGCADTLDFFYLEWGGIWGHVGLEARNPVHLTDLHIQSKINPAFAKVSAVLLGDRAAADTAKLEILDKDGKVVLEKTSPLKGENISLEGAIPSGHLWSDNDPYLYTAKLSLLKGTELVDSMQSRFGIRLFETKGTDFYLNGKKIFLRGYGDDHIYPEHFAFPLDKELYLKRIRLAKSYGFNYVRHHSVTMPTEYYDACDELGLLVQAEHPIAYKRYYEKAEKAGEGAAKTHIKELTATLKRCRNHPSIIAWCMSNEMGAKGPSLTPEFKKLVNDLDPGRLFIHTDGADVGTKSDTLDYYTPNNIALGRNFPLSNPYKYDFGPNVDKPVVSHETGNYITFPRFENAAAFESSIVKPTWYDELKKKLEEFGLLAEAPLWSKNSERLYLACHKINMEAHRKESHMAGYHWWLFQDFWHTSNGLVDQYYRPKSITPDEVLPFNQEIVLLEKGLDFAYKSGGKGNITLMVSNYSPASISNAAVTWVVRGKSGNVAEGKLEKLNIRQGEIKEIGKINPAFPEVKNPERLTLEVSIAAANNVTSKNSWITMLYPSQPEVTTAVPVYTDLEIVEDFAFCGAKAIPEQLESGAIYITNRPDEALIAATEKGATLILLDHPWLDWPKEFSRFNTGWWAKGNLGTVIYDNPVVTPDMVPEGWCDVTWFRLLNGSAAFDREKMQEKPEVLVRNIEGVEKVPDQAFLMQSKIGEGRLIVNGFGFASSKRFPEGKWFLAQLVKYAGTQPAINTAIKADTLRKMLKPMPERPFVGGFAKIGTNKGDETKRRNYRGDFVQTYECQQKAAGNSLTWTTEPVPADLKEKQVTFVFGGGVERPPFEKNKGFLLLLNGEEILDFHDVAKEQEGKKGVKFYYQPKFKDRIHSTGVFYVTVPAELLAPGKSAELTIRSKDKSRGVFIVFPDKTPLK